MYVDAVCQRAQGESDGGPEDRRAFERHPTDVEVLCRPLGGSRDDAWHARLQNISPGGVGLLLERRFEAGTMLVVDLAAPAAGRSRTLMARVMHVSAQAAREWRLGVALLREVTPEELRDWGAAVSRPEAADGGCRPEPAPPPGQVAGGSPAEPQPPAPATDPGFACLCSTWPALPAHVREAILALVRGCQAHPDVRA
jgi:hypothetical protein